MADGLPLPASAQGPVDITLHRIDTGAPAELPTQIVFEVVARLAAEQRQATPAWLWDDHVYTSEDELLARARDDERWAPRAA